MSIAYCGKDTGHSAWDLTYPCKASPKTWDNFSGHMQVEANRLSVENDSSQWIRLEQQGSQSRRSLEEGAESSAQQRRRQGRDLSSMSTALWSQEWHLASVGEGCTVWSGPSRSIPASRALTKRTGMSWKYLPIDKQQHNSQGQCESKEKAHKILYRLQWQFQERC